MDRNCKERVGLFLSARGLPKMDIRSHTDAFCVLYCKDRAGVPQFVGNTSVVRESENPDWAEQLNADYYFEMTQQMIIRVYDQDAKAQLLQLDKHDYIGEVTFNMATLMCAPGQRLEMEIVQGTRKRGRLSVRGEAATGTRDIFCGQFAGHKLTNKDGWFGRSDPFLVISRLAEDGSYVPCWKNDKIDNNLNPVWPPCRIPLAALCNGDIDRPLKIEVWDWESSGKNQFMGHVMTSVRALVDSRGAAMNVIEPEKQKNKAYTNSGTLTIANCLIEVNPTLTEFIAGGCEISLMVAIDFTGSNGDPMSPQSLHYIDRSNTGHLNAYQAAIKAVGDVLEEYDTDKMYPVFGFGARVRMPNGQFTAVQHCFPVYGGGQEVFRVDGILKAYADAIQNVALSGPTLFAPLIQNATAIAAAARCSQEKQKYSVLLIITDGIINDMEATIASIVNASNHPLSIIIVGVGNENFSSMHVLDGDGVKLRSGATVAARDIVQFVPFNEYASKGPYALAEDVLREVPTQLLQFMASRGIRPNAPVPPPTYSAPAASATGAPSPSAAASAPIMPTSPPAGSAPSAPVLAVGAPPQYSQAPTAAYGQPVQYAQPTVQYAQVQSAHPPAYGQVQYAQPPAQHGQVQYVQQPYQGQAHAQPYVTAATGVPQQALPGYSAPPPPYSA